MVFENVTREKLYSKALGYLEQPSSLDVQFVQTLTSNLSDFKLATMPSAVFRILAGEGLRLIQEPLDNGALIEAKNLEIKFRGETQPVTLLQSSMPDHPFIVRSVLLALQKIGAHPIHSINSIFSVERDAKEGLKSVKLAEPDSSNMVSLVQMVLPQLTDHDQKSLLKSLKTSLKDVQALVQDFEKMKDSLVHCKTLLDEEEGQFIDWVLDNNFVMMGIQFIHASPAKGTQWKLDVQKCLGVEKLQTSETEPLQNAISQSKKSSIKVRKTDIVANIYRSGLIDEIIIQLPGEEHNVVVLRGIYTSRAIRIPGGEIPLLRRKMQEVLERNDLIPGSFHYKSFEYGFNSLPVEYLFEAGTEAIDELLKTVVAASEQTESRAHVSIASHERSLFAFAVVPSHRFSEEIRPRIRKRLVDSTDAYYFDDRVVRTEFDNSVIHVYLSSANRLKETDPEKLEAIVRRAIDPWRSDIRQALDASQSPERAERLYYRYAEAFSRDYRNEVPTTQSLRDIEKLEHTRKTGEPSFDLFELSDASDTQQVYLRIYQGRTLSLSEVLPILEHFDIKILDENREAVQYKDGATLTIDTFRVQLGEEDAHLMELTDIILDAISAAMHGKTSCDSLLRLCITAGLSWQEVDVIRASVHYLRQSGGIGSRLLARNVLLNHPDFARQLYALFQARFDPDAADDSQSRKNKVQQVERAIKVYYKKINTFAEDQILRAIHRLIHHGVARTNFYLPHRKHDHLISLKVCHDNIDWLPSPRPRFEIFVQHANVEGVHMRSGQIARGGLRYSDRSEDYRTEVLGLMLTQRVKNSIIVPMGAKGGFVLKQTNAILKSKTDNEKSPVESAYDNFVTGLLEVTDNQTNQDIVRPKELICYDKDDSYLVVAADKGTATFSDRANAISAEHDFWMEDAFASGGSVGYDHKKMGITAKGAWVCTKRHFLEMDIDPEKDPIRIIGIGDMSGDVFGNGLLCSQSAQLVAAFNHRHIFLDPTPDPATSYQERLRLFNLPRSTWEDYDANLISDGGGVFSRQAREISLSPEVQEMLDTDAEKLSGEALIQTILKADVDLLWNGGIGTYIKASSERHEDVQDKSNDGVRVSATEVRAKVIGEGGNLGITQSARVEFALKGGRVNTDAIDNSGGVDCSDHEVNLKILFRKAIANGELEKEKRDDLLRKLEDRVGEMVLNNNWDQALMLSIEESRISETQIPHELAIQFLASDRVLDPALHRLPSAKEVLRRIGVGIPALTRPELAILCAHAKIHLQRCLTSASKASPFALDLVQSYFPEDINESFSHMYEQHPLYREIAAMMQAHHTINEGGATIIPGLVRMTDCSPADAANAWWLMDTSLGTNQVRVGLAKIEAEGSPKGKLSPQIHYEVRDALSDGLVEGASWLLRLHPSTRFPGLMRRTEAYSERCTEYMGLMKERLPKKLTKRNQEITKVLKRLSMPKDLINRFTLIPYAPALVSLEHIERTGKRRATPETICTAYMEAAKHTRLLEVYFHLASEVRDDVWESRALSTLKVHLLGYIHSFTELLLDIQSCNGASNSCMTELAAEMFENRLELDKLQDLIDQALGRSRNMGRLVVLSEAYRRRVHRLNAILDNLKKKAKDTKRK